MFLSDFLLIGIPGLHYYEKVTAGDLHRLA